MKIVPPTKGHQSQIIESMTPEIREQICRIKPADDNSIGKVSFRHTEDSMKNSSDNSEQDKTARCFEDNPWQRLIPSIFEGTQAKLDRTSKRLTKLLHFVGGVFGDDLDEFFQSKEYLGLRQWYLARLKHLNRELYRQIGDMVQIKLAVADALERLTIAELEKSVENNLDEDDLK